MQIGPRAHRWGCTEAVVPWRLSEPVGSTEARLDLLTRKSTDRAPRHIALTGRLSHQAMWGAAMDVGGWLRNLGLGQYEANFRDNKIDVDVLADLTDGDLEKLGLPLGDRKRLLKAIPDLVGLQSATRISEPVRTRTPSAAAQSISAERRPITVMFCDLVGSTSLAAKLDAEDWRTLVNTYLDEASAAVTGLGGHVLKKLGDGLMALFGYPHAQENDAERAVRAALAIQRALVEINARNASKGAPSFPRGSALIPGRWWSTQRAKCSATRPISPRGSRAPPSPARS